MTAILAAALLTSWPQPTDATSIQGKATYYRDGLMQEVLDYRGLGFADGVALNRAGDLGRVVWLQWGDGSIDGPFVVADCAQRAHYIGRKELGRVVEVSAKVAKEKGFYGVGPVRVIVWFEFPRMVWQ